MKHTDIEIFIKDPKFFFYLTLLGNPLSLQKYYEITMVLNNNNSSKTLKTLEK